MVAYATLLVGTVAVVAVLADPGQGEEFLQDTSMGLVVAMQAFLWVGYVGLAVLVSNQLGRGPRRDYGWRFSPRDWYQGLIVGAGVQLLAVPILYSIIFIFTERQDVSEAARELTDMATSPLDSVLLVLIVAIGAPIVEELFFRGLLMRSIQRRFGPVAAVIGSSAIFAAVHFQALQFPALMMFGLVAAWLTMRTGRLGPAIWAHVGFNGVTVAVLLSVS